MIIDWKSFVYKYKRPPKKQFPAEMVVYKGHQGCGKSLSLTCDAFDIAHEFKGCVIFSNMILWGLDYTPIKNNDDLMTALQYRNGEDGVLIILDEAQNYFNKKSGVPIEIMAQFCQNRKNRRCILMTSQIWEDLDVMLRKQVKTVVNCKCLFGKIQVNSYLSGYDLTFDKMSGEFVAPKKYTKIFKHNKRYYARYETLEVIQTNKSYDRTLTMAQGAPPAPVSVIQQTKKKGIF